MDTAKNKHTANWGNKNIIMLKKKIEGLKWVNNDAYYQDRKADRYGTVADIVTQNIQSMIIDLHGRFTDTGILTEKASSEIAAMIGTKSYPQMRDVIIHADRLNYLNESELKNECAEILQADVNNFCDSVDMIVKEFQKAVAEYTANCPK